MTTPGWVVGRLRGSHRTMLPEIAGSQLRGLLMLLALLAPLTAHATVHYVGPDGDDRGKGLGPGGDAWQTVARANSTVAPGDVVRILPGTYVDAPDPACVEGKGWISYIGNISNPSAVVIRAAVALADSHVVVKGMTLAGPLKLSGAQDSILDCIVAGDIDWNSGNRNFLGRNTCNGSRFTCVNDSVPGFQVDGNRWIRAKANQFKYNAFTAIGSDLTPSNPWYVWGADSNLFMCNTYTVRETPANSPTRTYWRAVGFAKHNTFYHEKTTIEGFYGNEGDVVRDSACFNRWIADTLIEARPSTEWAHYTSASGHYGNSVYGNTYDSCYVKVAGAHSETADYAGMQFQDGINMLTMRYTTVVCSLGAAIRVENRWQGRTLVDHCTFVGSCGTTVPGGGVVRDLSSVTWQDTIVFRNSIVYALGRIDPTGDFPYRGEAGRSAVCWTTKRDSTYVANASRGGRGKHDNHLVSDHNLYGYYGRHQSCRDGYPLSDTIGMRSIVQEAGATECGKLYVWPGTHAKYGINKQWSVKWCPGCDDSSRYGTPAFRDSTYARFNPSLRATSGARRMCADGSDAGAVQYRQASATR